MKIKRTKKLYNFILIIFLVLCSTVFFNNKTIEKETTKNNLKALDQEGQNYRLVTSADNVQVPVPKGYVASQVTGENYVIPEYQHTTNTYKVSSTPTELTWSSPAGEQYPWTQDSNGIWISGNQGISNSESVLESEEFDYIKGTTLTINYTYSSQSGDYYSIYLINLTNNTPETIVRNCCGNTDSSFDYTTSNYTYTMNDWATGRYKIKAIYNKNGDNINEGQDSGYIKTSTYYKGNENGTEIFEEDIKTKIHDGGFVIYQLTDEEIETDPNGTNVIINDTNKDNEQSERNQYVWVPIPNIEDIVRTKTANNGIMQFGQNYIFSNTSITKVTNTNPDYYREPRIVENYDKTKYYLQKYSNINNRENYLNKMQEDFTRLIKSINKYKGFYIGRYETGDDISHNSSIKYYKNPKTVRYNEKINGVTWYDSYKALERLAGKTGEYVETGMLSDSLYDYTLKWLNETDTRSYKDIKDDSGTWGNYINVSFKYKESANEIERTKDGNIINIRTPTGGITEITYKGGIYNNYPTSSNNIFDIAGNVDEWTKSRDSAYSGRTRGGYCGNFYSNYATASYINTNNQFENGLGWSGVRSELLIR